MAGHRDEVAEVARWAEGIEKVHGCIAGRYGVGLNHMPSGRFAANGAWLAIQVMAHNLARWTAHIGLGEQIVTTRTLRRRVFALVGTDHPIGAPPHPASATALVLGNPVQSRPWHGCEPFHSRPEGLPATDPNVPENSHHPGPREFLAAYSLAIPHIAAPADGHRDPARRLKTVRRPPIYPNGAQSISPVAPSPPSAVLTPSIGVFWWIWA